MVITDLDETIKLNKLSEALLFNSWPHEFSNITKKLSAVVDWAQGNRSVLRKKEKYFKNAHSNTYNMRK